MEIDEIVSKRNFDVFFIEQFTTFLNHLSECCMPSLTEFIHSYEASATLMDSNISIKRRTVPSDSYLLLYLTHLPVPLAAGLELEMRTDNLIKNVTDLC